MYYAKSHPIETIKEHSNKLIENLELLKVTYGDRITKNISIDKERFWKLMTIICKYHDVGKAFTPFQNIIRKKLNLPLIKTQFNYDEIKHEQISPIFIPYKELELNMEERILVYQAIYYHHERDSIHIDRNLLERVIEEDIVPNTQNINRELDLNIDVKELKTSYLSLVEGRSRITENNPLYQEYCIMKGLLNRLDHASSGGLKIEDNTNERIDIYTEKYLNNKLRPIQEFARENNDKNLVIIGSTGIGKTEAALIWSSDYKSFFTLPLRVSINAIYDRILEKIQYKHVGLLHSTAIEYLEEKDEFNNELQKIEQSRNLCEKITTSTIDQIFTFVFKYKGYEKILSTLSYSKIIIDEIQAYTPEIVAIILKGLQMINNIGGRFMVMTATLPRIYKEELEKMGIEFEFHKFTKNINRHKIQIKENNIDNCIDEIISKGKANKILVIANTVNKAIKIYKEIRQKSSNVNLLHARFTIKDRGEKEKNIKQFSDDCDKNGIWITTQMVEASLDIDFDYLFTEMSTLDSLFQRMGRCFRNREYLKDEANVKIFVKDISGIKSVYDEEILNLSINLIKNYDNKIIDEETKIELVDKLYSKELIENTQFYKNFKNGLSILNNLLDYDVDKKKAQKLLRDIDTINVIPKLIYEENIELFENYKNENDYDKKLKLKRKINQFTISIRKSYIWKLQDNIFECPMINDLFIISTKYSKDEGLILEMDKSDDINNRIM